jgi:tripartite-type tricarboxylate transporter receptor subunit TctC
MKLSRLVLAALLATCSVAILAQSTSTEPALSSSKGSGQAYPSKAVRVIVPYPPGGGADFVSRVFAKSLSDALGQQCFVDNRPGANGNIGAEITAKAPPNGYTLLSVANM